MKEKDNQETARDIAVRKKYGFIVDMLDYYRPIKLTEVRIVCFVKINLLFF